jgi:hypothetical protein
MDSSVLFTGGSSSFICDKTMTSSVYNGYAVIPVLRDHCWYKEKIGDLLKEVQLI